MKYFRVWNLVPGSGECNICTRNTSFTVCLTKTNDIIILQKKSTKIIFKTVIKKNRMIAFVSEASSGRFLLGQYSPGEGKWLVENYIARQRQSLCERQGSWLELWGSRHYAIRPYFSQHVPFICKITTSFKCLTFFRGFFVINRGGKNTAGGRGAGSNDLYINLI